MRALLIEFDARTGKRAGGIEPKDPKLQCYGWQDLERNPALEIRLVEDDRDLSSLEGVAGVTILEGKTAINEAITANIPARYTIADMSLLVQHLRDKKEKLDRFAGKSISEIGAMAFQLGIAGVQEVKPQLLE